MKREIKRVPPSAPQTAEESQHLVMRSMQSAINALRIARSHLEYAKKFGHDPSGRGFREVAGIDSEDLDAFGLDCVCSVDSIVSDIEEWADDYLR